MNLPEHELKAIQSYIEQNAYEDSCTPTTEKADISYILRNWRDSKSEYLYNLFGGELILSKNVTITKTKEDFTLEFSALCEKYYTFIYQATRQLLETGISKGYLERANYYDYLWMLNQFFVGDVLFENKTNLEIDLPAPDGRSLKFQVGSKAMRALSKIVETYNLDVEAFEDFRLDHSRILNQKTFTGNLCLSIHPLDYMTMSDNENDWSSCMSWRDEGCYRAGTVEMMNSPSTIVAYLASEDDMSLLDYNPSNIRWNNKKWRSLFVIDNRFITSVKGYPYQQEDLTRIIIGWLAELAYANLGWEYDNNIYSYKHTCPIADTGTTFRFITNGWMYNDFGSTTHYCTLAASAYGYHIKFCYGGEALCMHCGGSLTSESEQNLLCNDCYSGSYCAHCGCHAHEDELYCALDGEFVCEDCLSDYYVFDHLQDGYIPYDDAVEIHLLDEDGCSKGSLYTAHSFIRYHWSNAFSSSCPHEIESANPYESSYLGVYENEVLHRWTLGAFS